MTRLRKTAIIMTILVSTMVVFVFPGCGNEGDEDAGAVPDADAQVSQDEVITIGDRPELRGFTRPSSVFEAEDFVDAGWKKNKEYPLETLPEATAALFGFYNRKDIELRFYPTHEIAMSVGKESAEQAIATEKVSGRGAGFSSVTLYGAYLIAGNVVMLCEFSVQDCTDLSDKIAK